MAKFCSQCGNPLTEGVSFCSKCGAKQTPVIPPAAPVTPAAPAAAPATNGFDFQALLKKPVTETRTLLILLGEQLLAFLLFLLPTVSVSVEIFGQSESKWYSIFSYLDETDKTLVFHILFVILLVAALALFVLPFLKKQFSLNIPELPLPEKLFPLVLLGVSGAFLLANIISVIVFSSDIPSMASDYITICFSLWGWLYLLVAAAANAHLFFAWKNSK